MEPTPSRSISGFVPALGFDLLTPLYDPLLRLTLREDEIKRRLLAQARIAAGMTVLDFGCGTGTLALLVKQTHPDAHVVGIDVDPRVLAIARTKLEAAGVDVELRCGRIEDAGLAPGSVDRVLTSLVLHHLTEDEKLSALAALHRALGERGELHVADFGRPHTLAMQVVSHLLQWVDGADRVGANFAGRLPELVGRAGFTAVEERGMVTTLFGTLAFLAARR
ncbi:MAG: class I SAM-dependent methyltransferase [bacterium]|nr:class I SAM-dependent methyltransferase [bacterium]